MTQKTNASNKNLWGSRFSKKPAEILEKYNASIVFDYKLYQQDIFGSIVHSKMLAKTQIISADEQAEIEKALIQIQEEIAQDPKAWAEQRISQEDIHMAVEARLTELIGTTAKKLHSARSRNDQVVTDLKLWLKDQSSATQELLKALRQALIERAKSDLNIIVPGYTHLQQAQPISLGHFWLAYEAKFNRDSQRLADATERLDINPLGSGALAGTTLAIDRDFTTKHLGFKKASENSLDAVSDRDYVLDYEYCLSLIMLHLSSLAEEMICWNSTEFNFISISDDYATGSSMMPQKKNPDIPELLRGKTGRVIGVLNALMITVKSLPLSYNKDLQEDKEQLFMANETAQESLTIAKAFLENISINESRCKEVCAKSFLNATDACEYLTTKQVPFREAYTAVGKAVQYCIEHNKFLQDLSLEEWQSFDPNYSKDIFEKIKIENVVDARDIFGGTARNQVKKAIELAKTRL